MKITNLEQRTLGELFRNQLHTYVIPDYQRPYSWGKKEIEEYIDDVLDAYRRQHGEYFLGSFILIEKDRGREFDIVDGQQRFTTTSIFLSVMRDMLAKDGNVVASEIQSTLLHRGSLPTIVTRQQDRTAYEHAFLKENLEVSQDLERLPESFSIARTLFRDRLAAFVADAGSLSDLLSYVLDRVSVVLIVTADLNAAYTIFERINYRGQELAAKDLLKNYLLNALFQELKAREVDEVRVQTLFQRESGTFLSLWQRAEDAELDMDESLILHREAVTGQRTKRDLFKEITNLILDAKLDAIGFLHDWLKTVDAHTSLTQGSVFGTLAPLAQNNIRLLKHGGNRYWQAILIAAVRMGYDKPSLESLTFHIERLFALSRIAGDASTILRDPAMLIIREYILQKKSVESIAVVCEQYLDRFQAIERAVTNLRGDCYSASWCRYVLAKFEYALTDASMAREIRFDKTVQIEHILPQTMTSPEWQKYFSSTEQHELVNTLGNLTLLIGSTEEKNTSKNQSASNKPFAEKIAIYTGQTLNDGTSAFAMTTDLKRYEAWTPEVIQTRTEEMLRALLHEWKINLDDVQTRLSARKESFDHPSLSYTVGTYDESELRERLHTTLQEDGKVNGYFRILLSVLVKETEPMEREALREALFAAGLGDTQTRTGHLMSNVSQFLTKKENDHLRQIVHFSADVRPGAPKDNYVIPEEYKTLVASALKETE